MVMRLDMNVTDPSRNLHDLKVLILNTVWMYMRTVLHFQLHRNPDVVLNETAFNFQVGINVLNFLRF